MPQVQNQESEQDTFQARVTPWMLECFGLDVTNDRTERNHRFLEEAIELVQSLGCSKTDAHGLVDHIYGRPVGEPYQEVGGVMVTLGALCMANGLDMHHCGDIELERIWMLVEKIRDRQKTKPRDFSEKVPVEHQDRQVIAWTTMDMSVEPISNALKNARPDLYSKHYTKALYA